MSKQIPKQEMQQVIAWFKEQFPKAFPARVKDIKPLQLGIMDEIMDFYDRLSYPPFSRKKLRAGLNYYTASPAYLKSQIAGKFRIDLFGFDGDAVTESQAEYAQERLAQYQKAKVDAATDKASETKGEPNSTSAKEPPSDKEEQVKPKADDSGTASETSTAQERTEATKESASQPSE